MTVADLRADPLGVLEAKPGASVADLNRARANLSARALEASTSVAWSRKKAHAKSISITITLKKILTHMSSCWLLLEFFCMAIIAYISFVVCNGNEACWIVYGIWRIWMNRAKYVAENFKETDFEASWLYLFGTCFFVTAPAFDKFLKVLLNNYSIQSN